MTDHEKLLVALLSESEAADAVHSAPATTLDLMAALYGIAPTRRVLRPEAPGDETAFRLQGDVGRPGPSSSAPVAGGASC